MKLITHYSLLITKRGAAALLTVLAIGGIVVEIGIAGLIIIYYLGQSGFGVKFSAEALAAAEAGIQDGLIKIVRNKNVDYTSSGSPYTITVGSRTAQVTICKDLRTVTAACDTANSGKHEITSLGIAFTKRRELRAILNVNSTNGEVKVESIQEIAL
jgi:hypothetical protein